MTDRGGPGPGGQERDDRRRQTPIRRRVRRARAARHLSEGGPLSLVGVSVPLLVVTLVLAALIGILLSYALLMTTRLGPEGTGLPGGTSGSVDGATTLPIVTESTLGPEVQQLIDAGYVETAAGFDVSACLSEQSVEDPVLIMEEIAWGPHLLDAWLIVHTPTDPSTLRTDGGVVEISVVLPTCGTALGRDVSGSLLWSGATILRPTRPGG
ncbi:hypothetical protein [Brachybacterium huguangmaarense]